MRVFVIVFRSDAATVEIMAESLEDALAILGRRASDIASARYAAAQKEAA